MVGPEHWNLLQLPVIIFGLHGISSRYNYVVSCFVELHFTFRRDIIICTVNIGMIKSRWMRLFGGIEWVEETVNMIS
jgi:hypothetical protein